MGSYIPIMKRESGITLVELIITLAIAAILLSLAVPSFRAISQNNKAVAQGNQFVTAFSYARSEAVKRHLRVSVCASNVDQTACSGSNTWAANGWIVFTDNVGTVGTIDAGDEILKVWVKLEGQSTVTTVPTDTANISYLQSGALSGGAVTLQLKVGGCTGDNARTISIAPTGRVSVDKTPC